MDHKRDALKARYEEAAEAVVAELRKHPCVVGIAYCGSIVSGDLWEGSDLDVVAVMREPQADWQAMTVRHGDVKVHLQLLSEAFLVSKSEGFLGGVISQVFSRSRVIFDPENVLSKAIAELTEYPRDRQVQNAIRHLIVFLGEYHLARKCVGMGYTEDAFLHTNIAFQELAFVEFARQGRYCQRIVMEELVSVSPTTYKAYVWFVHGRRKASERIRRSFTAFEQALEGILSDIGPALITVIKTCARPLTEEGLGQIPTIYDQSANLDFLVDRLVEHQIIRRDQRAATVEGIPASGLSEALFDLF